MELCREERTITVEYVCDNCAIGTMKLESDMPLGNVEPKYLHSCRHCTAPALLPHRYPDTRTETVVNHDASNLMLHWSALG